MKSNIIYLAFLAFLFSCSASHDKKNELNQLKLSREKLDDQISKLQAEIVLPVQRRKRKRSPSK